MSIAHWVPKATNTSSEYVIFIAIPQQQWLSERTSTLHVHCPSSFSSFGPRAQYAAPHCRRMRNHNKTPKSAPVTGQLATLNKQEQDTSKHVLRPLRHLHIESSYTEIGSGFISRPDDKLSWGCPWLSSFLPEKLKNNTINMVAIAIFNTLPNS
jgi:hypothetical protein